MTDPFAVASLMLKIVCTAVSLILGLRFRKDIKRTFCDFFLDADGMGAEESKMNAEITDMLDRVVDND